MLFAWFRGNILTTEPLHRLDAWKRKKVAVFKKIFSWQIRRTASIMALIEAEQQLWREEVKISGTDRKQPVDERCTENLFRIHPRASHQIRISKDAIVGCDVAAHVTSAWVLSDTRRGRPCEWSVNKGGNTSLYPRPFWRTGVFLCGSKGPAPSGCCTAARKRQPQIQPQRKELTSWHYTMN